jgi:hypothetical protein
LSAGFSGDADTALTFFDYFFVSPSAKHSGQEDKKELGFGAKPHLSEQLGIHPDIHINLY